MLVDGKLCLNRMTSVESWHEPVFESYFVLAACAMWA